MGFDVTFHPVDKQDLKYYLFDVVDNPSLSGSRASELTADVEKQEMVKALYGEFPEWLNDMENFDDSAYKARDTLAWRIRRFLGRYPRKYYEIGSTFGYAAAVIAGFRHPYWYSRGSALSFLSQYAPLLRFMFTPLPRLFEGGLSKVTDVSGGLINANYCASGYIEAGRIQTLETYLRSLEKRRSAHGEPILYRVFNDDAVRAITEAINYAKERELGLMEASDIVVPISGECASDPDNLRADWWEDHEL